MRVLNVGGGDGKLPPHYDGAREVLVLDANPDVSPAFCMDALEMEARKEELGEFDAVYSSHFLEHVYRHEIPKVLSGFLSVLKPGGVLEVIVPNVPHAMQTMLERKLELTDTYYRSASGPVSFHDVIYGWDVAMRGGNLLYSHKSGFSRVTLGEALQAAGFDDIQIADDGYNVFAKARKP